MVQHHQLEIACQGQIAAQDREVAEKSGKPALAIKTLVRA